MIVLFFAALTFIKSKCLSFERMMGVNDALSSTEYVAVVSSDDEDDFEDAVEEQTEQFTVVISPAQTHQKGHM